MARVVEGPAKKVEKEKSCETLFRDLTTKKVLNCWLGSGSALKRAIRNRPSSMMKKWDVDSLGNPILESFGQSVGIHKRNGRSYLSNLTPRNQPKISITIPHEQKIKIPFHVWS